VPVGSYRCSCVRLTSWLLRRCRGQSRFPLLFSFFLTLVRIFFSGMCLGGGDMGACNLPLLCNHRTGTGLLEMCINKDED